MTAETPRFKASVVRRRLSKLKMTQARLAKEMKLSPSTLSRALSGKAILRPRQMLKLCLVLDLSYDDVYQRDKSKDPIIVCIGRTPYERTS